MNFFGRFINVFVAPSSTFKSIKEKPAWVVPLVVVILLTVLLTYFMAPVTQEFTKKVTTERLEKAGMDEAQIDEILQKQAETNPIITYASAAVSTGIVLALGALIWFFVANVVLGGKLTYAQMLSGFSYRYFIVLAGSFLKLPIILQKKTLDVTFSPATFMPASSSSTFLYKFASQFDVFSIWAIAVLCVGIAVLAGLPAKKVWPWVALIYFLFYLGSASLRNIIGV